MIKRTITYVDYDGNERTEDFYFNLNRAELSEMQLTVVGGFEKLAEYIKQKQDIPKAVNVFKELLLKSYGEKSADGRRFMKSPEIVKNFEETEAYSILFMELATNENSAKEFMAGVVPADMREDMLKAQNQKAVAAK